MSLNSRKQRNIVYRYTFLKENVDKRLAIFLTSLLNASSYLNSFGNYPGKDKYLELCESLADMEIQLEVAEESLETLRSNIDIIKKRKLLALRKQSEANKLGEKANKVQRKAEEIAKSEIKPSWISRKLSNLRTVFN